MILNLIVIGAVLLIAYLWASRGFFSAFLHLLCTIVAGAIAFALWEPIAYGVLLGVRDDIAWSVSLVVPFVVSLAVLRLLVDKLLKNNIGLHDATNLVGGALCGGAAGLIAIGIFVISIGFLRVPPDFLGYRAATFAETSKGPGVLVRGASLWLPADKVVENFYGMTSEGSLATSTPLAVRAPDLDIQGNLQRYNYQGVGRTSLTPADFTVLGQYEVEPSNLDALLTDTFTTDPNGQPVTQKIVDIEGNPFPADSKLVGTVLLFKAGAKEKQGQVVIGPGQIRLLATNNTTGEVKSILPAAFVNQGDPLALDYKRWRYDSDGVFAASVGGAAESTMAFEFIVPPDYTAQEVQVRNVRVDLDAIPQNNRPGANPALTFASAQARDSALRDFSLLGAVGVDIKGGELASDEDTTEVLIEEGRNSIVTVTERLPFNGQFNRSRRGQLDITQDNKIIGGEEKFQRSEFSEIGLQENLRVFELGRTNDTRIVQVDVGLQSRLSLLGRAFQKATSVVPPVLVDSLGRQYQPIGYVFQNGDDFSIRFTPGDPIRGLAQIPSLSTSRTDQRLVLLFRVNSGAELTSFAIEGRVAATFSPTVRVGR
jgi:hypothetical protein